MTDQNDAALQHAEDWCAASDRYFGANPSLDTTDNRRIYSVGFDDAYSLLSKLRAQVADERAEFSAWHIGHSSRAPNLNAPDGHWADDKKAWAAWQERACRAAQASAPIVGEVIGYSNAIQWRSRQSEQSVKLTRHPQPEHGFVHAHHAAPSTTAAASLRGVQPDGEASADRDTLMRAIVQAGQKAGIVGAELEAVSGPQCLHILECLVSARVADGRPANPHTGFPDLADAWQKGFDGERPVLRAGGIYFEAYKEGERARQAIASASAASGDKAEISGVAVAPAEQGRKAK